MMEFGNESPEKIDIFQYPNSESQFYRYLMALHWCRGKDVLDVACGYGYGSHILKTFANSVIGMDIDPDAIAFARKQYPYITFIQDDILESGMINQFDVVVSIETFEHMPRHLVDLYLQKLVSWTKEGGTIFITTPQRQNPIFQYKNNQSHLYEYSLDEFTEVVISNIKGDYAFYPIQEITMGYRKHLVSIISPYAREGHIMVAVIRNVRHGQAGEPGGA